jgi:hypothetical protein
MQLQAFNSPAYYICMHGKIGSRRAGGPRTRTRPSASCQQASEARARIVRGRHSCGDGDPAVPSRAGRGPPGPPRRPSRRKWPHRTATDLGRRRRRAGRPPIDRARAPAARERGRAATSVLPAGAAARVCAVRATVSARAHA